MTARALLALLLFLLSSCSAWTTVNRRETLAAALALFVPAPAHAGEVGARITKAVTQSDLGISVRRSVVQGAQVMDGLDGRWEQFSDRFGLGSARSQQGGRPAPKEIPPLQPLDASLARQVIQTCDQVFVELTGLKQQLPTQVDKVRDTVRAAFERSGPLHTPLQSSTDLNFEAYVHFKAYSDLLVAEKVDFRPFKLQFERRLGDCLLQLLLPPSFASSTMAQGSSITDRRQRQLQLATQQLTVLYQQLVDKGFVALIDTAGLKDDEAIQDWSNDASDLSWTVALDGDVTMPAQILLQEQGFRLYPSWGRYAVQSILSQTLPDQVVDVSDYYFDTEYNSDPDRFEPREVLLNIVLEAR